LDWLSFCSRFVIRLNFQPDKIIIEEKEYPLPEGWVIDDAFTEWQELAYLLQKCMPTAKNWQRKIAIQWPLKAAIQATMVLPASLNDEQIEAEIKMVLNQDGMMVNFVREPLTSSHEVTVRYVAVQQKVIMDLVQCIAQTGWQVVSVCADAVSLPLYPSQSMQQQMEKKWLQYGVIFATGLALLILACLHGYQTILLNQLTDNVSELQTQLQQSSNVQTASITNQINTSLNKRRELWHLLQLFNQFDKQQVCIKELKIHDTDVMIKGLTRSAASLSAFLENWHTDGLFTQVNINQLDELPNQTAAFSLQAKRYAI
jgi:Tfp pilus assembly PilM family ATPase